MPLPVSREIARLTQELGELEPKLTSLRKRAEASTILLGVLEDADASIEAKREELEADAQRLEEEIRSLDAATASHQEAPKQTGPKAPP